MEDDGCTAAVPLANAEAFPHSRQLEYRATTSPPAIRSDTNIDPSTHSADSPTRSAESRASLRGNQRPIGMAPTTGKKSTPRHIRKVRRRAVIIQTSALMVVSACNPGSYRHLQVPGTPTNQLPNPSDAPTTMTHFFDQRLLLERHTEGHAITLFLQQRRTAPAHARPGTCIDSSSRNRSPSNAAGRVEPSESGIIEPPAPNRDSEWGAVSDAGRPGREAQADTGLERMWGCNAPTTAASRTDHRSPGNRLASTPRRISPLTTSKTRSFPPTHAADHQTLRRDPTTRVASEPAMSTADSPPALKLDCKKFGVTLPS